MFNLFTIKQGQRVAVWDRDGRRSIIEGPQRVRLWRGRRVEPLQPVAAGPAQYLVIQYRDGRIAHQRGPAVVWIDPVEHASVTAADALPLDANEAIVIYKQQEARVERRVLRGPELFVPDANEWLHEFRWHGSDPKDARRKIPRALVFRKLRVIPDQMYYDVENVRTADDALITVKLMIFFELIDITVMLDQTHDPIADFMNSVSADIIDFAAALSFEQFKERTEKLNIRETYAQLAQRAGRIGYRVNKVVYRGYEASPKLQSMHDGAIEARTRLKLEAETERQAQDLADLKLQRERERAAEKQRMEQADLEHQNRLKRLTSDEQIRQQQTQHEFSLRQQQADTDEILRRRRLNNDLVRQKTEAHYQQKLQFVKSLRELQVDLTQYLVARHQLPERRIRVDGSSSARPQLHLHDSRG